MTDTTLTNAEIRRLRRVTSPRMHIWLEMICVAMGVLLVVCALLAVFGVLDPLDPVPVLLITATLATRWVQDLVETVQSERNRLRMLREVNAEIERKCQICGAVENEQNSGPWWNDRVCGPTCDRVRGTW